MKPVDMMLKIENALREQSISSVFIYFENDFLRIPFTKDQTLDKVDVKVLGIIKTIGFNANHRTITGRSKYNKGNKYGEIKINYI
jgi:hypothetical protein